MSCCSGDKTEGHTAECWMQQYLAARRCVASTTTLLASYIHERDELRAKLDEALRSFAEDHYADV